jgi:purine catabolism regulator
MGEEKLSREVDLVKTIHKRNQLKEKIETHLRRTARQLVRFDTLEETLHYLLESFHLELTCDFVAIIVKEGELLFPRAWRGQAAPFEQEFPLSLEHCSPNLLEDALWWPNDTVSEANQCKFQKILEKSNLSTWFTVPLKDDTKRFGFCVIGFHKFVPLIMDLEQIFVEFGKDVAVAISLAQDKEVQKMKIMGIEWIRENVYLGLSIEQIVEKIVERAGKGTFAEVAYIYLYDEAQNCFFYQPPSYGFVDIPQKIGVKMNDPLKEYFPFLERPGGDELTVPLVVNLKTIGVLHVARRRTGKFTKEDLDLLEFLSCHVSALVETARLYRNEMEQKNLLQTIMFHHRELVRQTVEGENLDGISRSLSTLFSRSIIVFDRLLRPISCHLWEKDASFLETAVERVRQSSVDIARLNQRELWLKDPAETGCDLGIWPVIGGGDLLGFLAIQIRKEELDDVLRMTIDHALHVYSIQFIKQKLVMDTREQLKDSFISQLFEEHLVDREKILQFASLFHWNPFQPHRIGVLTIELPETAGGHEDLLDREQKKSWLWEQIRFHLSGHDPGIVFSRKGDQFILILPSTNEKEAQKNSWRLIYQRIKTAALAEMNQVEVLLGIGGRTAKLEDYYSCYHQAVQTHKLISHRFRQTGFAVYEDLGEYTLLNSIDESTAKLFIRKYLEPLIRCSKGKGADLFLTLRSYLEHNGNFRDTKEDLFIHRSTLTYRLEKIRDILGFDLEKQRFNLMLAFKLYDLYHSDFGLKKEEK